MNISVPVTHTASTNYIYVSISSPTPAGVAVLGTLTSTVITADPAPTLTFSSDAVNAGGSSSATITVQRYLGFSSTPYSTGVSSATWTITSGGSGSGTVTVGNGATSTSFTIPVTHYPGNTSTVYVSLTGFTGALAGQVTSLVVTVDPSSSVSLNASLLEIPVGSNTATLTFTRDASHTGDDLTVFYKTVNGTGANGGLAGTDYTAVTSSFSWLATDPASTKTVSIPVTHRDGRLFTVQITSVTNGNIGVSTESVLVDPLPTVSFTSAQQGGVLVARQGETVTIPVTRSLTAGTSTVNYTLTPGSATNPADFSGSLTGTISFANGAATSNISVTIPNWVSATVCSSNKDPASYGNKTFTITLSSPTGALLGIYPSMTVFIAPPSLIDFRTFTTAVVGGHTMVTYSYARATSAVGAVTVNVRALACGFHTCDTSQASVHNFSITWADGETGVKSYTYDAWPDTGVNGDSATITAGSYVGAYSGGRDISEACNTSWLDNGYQG